jgi:SAM-dependent methyltransferase
LSAILRTLPFERLRGRARAIHVVEHFWPWEAVDVVTEWVRVLKPGGQLAIECPCLDKVLYLMQVPEAPPAMTYWALYGDPRHKDPAMMHRWCYGKLQLVKLMMQAGLVNIRPEPVQFHHPIRDMRIVGNKPERAIALA